MPVIKLEALDTLFFRDGKPFTMGEDSFAEGAFPPSPSVIYGALRTAYIAQQLGVNGKNMDNFIADTEGVVITNIAFEFEGTLLYPMPLDYVERKDKENEAICLSLIENTITDKSPAYLCYANEHVEQVNDGILEEAQLGDYLDGNTALKVEIKKWSDLITSEAKFGNSRNDISRSTSDDDGNVYRVSLRRLENSEFKRLKFIVEYYFTDTIKNGLIRLGGEGKAAEITDSNYVDLQMEQFSEKHFKIILQTPALFEGGNEPDLKWFSNKGFDVKLLAKVVGKPVKIGGWDILEKQPKSMLSATPTGSVFYYEITNNKTVKAFLDSCKTVHSISDKRQKEGFGLFKIANLVFNPIEI